MSVGIELSTTQPGFRNADKIDIAQLSPDRPRIELSHIEANVALVWPYSSSTQRLSLLLVEKDVRLRASKGQVKVTFHGSCAREVAETRIGIGATVKLGLQAVEWIRTGDIVSTPGKKVDWDINFSQQVRLEVLLPNGRSTLVESVAEPQTSVTPDIPRIRLGAPATSGLVIIPKTRLLSSRNTPKSKRSDRLSSGSFIDASLDPFADDDGFIVGRSRKRTKFARYSGGWRYVDEEGSILIQDEKDTTSGPLPKDGDDPAIPVPISTNSSVVDRNESVDARVTVPNMPSSTNFALLPERVMHDDDNSETVPRGTDGVHTLKSVPPLMGPPPLPRPSTPEMQPRPLIEIPNDLSLMPTPVLRPILSPGLALVSPLIERSGLMTSYFPTTLGPRSELDSASHVATAPQSSVASPSVMSDGDTIQMVREHDRSRDLDGIEEERGLEPHSTELDSEDLQNQDAQRHQNKVMDRYSHLGSQQEVDATIKSNKTPVSPTFAFSGVDLDALQQHIDESSRLLQDDNMQPQWNEEDEDMYGPPARSRHKAAANTFTTDDFKNTMKVSNASIHSESQIEPQSSVRIDSASEVEEIESGVYPKTSVDENDLNEEGNGDDQGENHVISVPSDSQDANSPDDILDDHVTAATDEIAPPSSEEPSDIDFIAGMPSQSSIKQDLRQFDGILEPFESEELRNQLRATTDVLDVSNNVHTVISLSTSASPKLSQLIEVEMDDQQVQRFGQNSASPESSMIESSQSPIREASPIEANPIDARPIHDHPSELSDALPTRNNLLGGHSSKQVHKYQNVMLTPDATQQVPASITSGDETIPSILPPVLPLSPRLTQHEAMHDAVSSPTEAVSDADVEKDKSPDQVPPQLKKEPGKAALRSSRRLSRKSFTGEVVTEYFTPRRSARIIQSSPTSARFPQQIASFQQPASPPRSTRVLRSSSPMISRDATQTTMLSPNRLRGTTTQLSYFPHLSSITEYFGSQIDVIGVCSAHTSPPQKAKAGPRDYHTSLYLVDPSFIESNTPLIAQIFRPRKSAIPLPERGDIVLLRNMKVQTSNHQAMLMSTDSSAWAVFKRTPKRGFQILISGPPVEYGEAEKVKATELQSWWVQDGESRYSTSPTMQTTLDSQNATRTGSPIVTRSHTRQKSASENIVGEIGDTSLVSHKLPGVRERASPKDDVSSDHGSVSSRNPSSPIVATRKRRRRRAGSERSDSVVHELRDGTQYIDDPGRRRSGSVIHELRDGSTYVDE